MAFTALDDDVYRVLSAAFDPDFYAAIYTDLPSGMDPFWHYRAQGWKEERDAAAWFSAHFYFVDNPDLKRGKIDPFHHFLTLGRYQGREVRPSHHAAPYLASRDWAPEPFRFEAFVAGPPHGAGGGAPEPAAISQAQERAAVAEAFDAAFYQAINPDVAASGMDPLAHFLITGWLEGRDPTPRFSVRDYLEAYPDVAAAGVNPFAHYLIAGRAEGRLPRHDLGFRYDVIARLKPPAERIADARAIAAGLATGDPAELAVALGTLGDLHITFSHDDFLAHAGGLQLCVRREAARFAERGVAHLHLHPQALWHSVRVAGEPGPLGVMLNGERLGVFTPQAVRAGVAQATAGPGRRTFAIHSLLGHEPDETADIAAAAGLSAGYFWLHDFASLCAGFHLLRNDVADCAAPPADSAACAVCAYGTVRARHTHAHRRLFERLKLTVAAPSKTTLAFWQAHGDLPAARSVVLPHAELKPRGPASRPGKDRPFRLGFLGVPTPLKGFPLFRELAERLADDPRYEFHHLGARPDPATPASFHPVVATPNQPQAMQDAAEALELDAALIWPLCRETFSFTAYEAAAAGAAVITGPDSGNVAAFVAASGLGRVLDDEAALIEAFTSGAILALARGRRAATLYDLAYSGLSGDLVGPARRRAT
jgi:glycosyltransferase involved in cell wall biosynthesis